MIYRDSLVGAAGQAAPTNGLQPPLQNVYVVVNELDTTKITKLIQQLFTPSAPYQITFLNPSLKPTLKLEDRNAPQEVEIEMYSEKKKCAL